MTRWLATAFLVTALPLSTAQETKPLSETGVVTCAYPSPSGNLGKWAISPAGLAAAVEVRATVTGAGAHRRCITSWKLHIRRKEGKESILTVAEREDNPDDNEWIQENSFEIEGWSKNGLLLLASQIEVQGDWDETTPVVFDSAADKYWRVELYPLFKRLIPPDCYVVYRALRFSGDGTVLIGALSTDDDREPGTKPCFAEGRWELDFRRGSLAGVRSASKDE